MTDVFARRPGGEPGPRFYAAGVSPHLSVPEVTLPALLDEAARGHGGRTALSHRGRRTGFRALHRSVLRVATNLERLGVRRGTWLLLLLPDCPELVVLYRAAWRIGAVAVPWDPTDHGAAAAALAARAGSAVAVVPEERAAEVAGRWGCVAVVTVGVAVPPRARPSWAVDDAGKESGTAGSSRVRVASRPSATAVVVAYRDLDRRRAGTLPEVAHGQWSRDPQADDIAAVLHRREGAPIVLCHRHLVAAAHQLASWYPQLAGGRARMLSLVPLWTVRGLVLGALVAPLVGARVVLVVDPSPATALRAARRAAPTVLAASPATLRGLLARPAHEHEALATIRTVVTAPLGTVTGARLRAVVDARVIAGYGPAAACGVALANPPTADARSGTAGLALPGTQVRIAVEGTLAADALPGHAGELLLRGPQVSRLRVGGYQDALPGGWVRTGRLELRGPDGFVTLLDDDRADPDGGGPDGAASAR
ncbi:AMP-binding protein [Streptomyces sp. SID8379]|uniref:AMP-binding protein n=1 Tax=unclassified Streptomyces TaxID=2593676 RepID=UPI000379FFA1|nr:MULTISPECIES: AMP-binding protein [unclassified Streptomyces]MYW63467.1 AMP-binding protein [Streptomyces sp. SID8379]